MRLVTLETLVAGAHRAYSAVNSVDDEPTELVAGDGLGTRGSSFASSPSVNSALCNTPLRSKGVSIVTSSFVFVCRETPHRQLWLTNVCQPIRDGERPQRNIHSDLKIGTAMPRIRIGKKTILNWGKTKDDKKGVKSDVKGKPLGSPPNGAHVHASPGACNATVDWASGNEGADNWRPYSIEYKRARASSLGTIWRVAATAPEHSGSRVVGGLKSGKLYKFRVLANGGPELGRDFARIK